VAAEVVELTLPVLVAQVVVEQVESVLGLQG
jgi:hypothetical protein